MLIQRAITVGYEEEIKAATSDMKNELSKITMDLLSWCTKWRREISDPVLKDTFKFRFLENKNGEAEEMKIETFIQDSITPNKNKLSSLDEKIFSTYLSLRKVGFTKPSVVASESFWRNILNNDAMMDKEKDSWPSINLMDSRLQDNSRIGTQLSLGGNFLRKTYLMPDGVMVTLGKEELIGIMKKRKLVR
jgi:hypothetical protein